MSSVGIFLYTGVPGKSWILSFSKKSWKTDISREKKWNFAETISSVHDIRLPGSPIVCIYKIYALLHTHSVCVVMIVVVRGGHLYLSKKFKFMVKGNIRRISSYAWLFAINTG